MDLRSDRISNRLILLGWFLAFPYQIYLNGARGIFVFSLQAILPVILFYLMYRLRALGAGDIKLLSLLSVFLGKEAFFCAIPYIFAAAGLIGISKLLYRRILIERVKYLLCYAGQTILTGRLSVYDGEERAEHWDNRIHFSVPILIGYLGYVCRNWGNAG